MLDFFSDVIYWGFLIAILVLTTLITRNSLSKKVVEKQPNALLVNNSLIIINVILMILVFVFSSWLAGILTIVLAFICYIIAGGIFARKSQKKLLEDIKKSSNDGTD